MRPLHQEPVRVGGIEPPLPVWKTGVLPLHHTRVEQAAEAGIEPAGDVLNRHAQLPAVAPPQRVCAAGFEPAISTSQASRDGQLPYAQLHSKSVQRESNPHFRHGKAVGCRYIMDAVCLANSVVKEHQWGRRESNPQRPG